MGSSERFRRAADGASVCAAGDEAAAPPSTCEAADGAKADEAEAAVLVVAAVGADVAGVLAAAGEAAVLELPTLAFGEKNDPIAFDPTYFLHCCNRVRASLPCFPMA